METIPQTRKRGCNERHYFSECLPQSKLHFQGQGKKDYESKEYRQVHQKMKKVLHHVNYMKINKIFNCMHSASETLPQ